MALKDTGKHLKTLLQGILGDLDKADAGNKAAAQRVRTQSIRFEKAAKQYRKESIKADKSGLMKKVKAAVRKPVAKKSKPAAAKKSHAAKKPAKKSSARRATARLPKRGKR